MTVRSTAWMTAATSLLIMAGVACLASCGTANPAKAAFQESVVTTTGLPVFPGAEGFGVDTPAGRGGAVIHVTSLAAEGPGTLREALATAGPRTIVFDVGGIIDATEPLVITEPFVTVAGQTAPGSGITIIGTTLCVVTHDVLIQHLRLRPGDRPNGPDPGGRDGIAITSNADFPAGTHHVVIDHCSVSWALDEGMSTWGPDVHDITFRRCIIAENLSKSIHPEGEHSKGLLIGDHGKRIAVIGNLFASNMQRSPFVKGDVSALIANNFISNPGQVAIHFGDLENSGPSLGTVIGNVLLPGQDTRRRTPLVALLIDMDRATRVYGMDNDPGGRALWRSWLARKAWRDIAAYAEAPLRCEPLTLRPVAEVRNWVLDGAGAWPAGRDEVDLRIVAAVREGRGRIIDAIAEVGGFPATATVTRPAEVPADPHGDADGDGYTNLEAWLHKCAARAEGAGPM